MQKIFLSMSKTMNQWFYKLCLNKESKTDQVLMLKANHISFFLIDNSQLLFFKFRDKKQKRSYYRALHS